MGYYVLIDRVAPAQNKYMASIFNPTGTAVRLAITRIFKINAQVATVAGAVLEQEFRRQGGTTPTGGTVVTIRKEDESDPNPTSGIEVRTGPTGGVTEGVLIRRFMNSNEEGSALGVSNIEDFMANANESQILYRDLPFIGQTILLRPNQGLLIKNITNSTVGTCSYIIEWEEEPENEAVSFNPTYTAFFDQIPTPVTTDYQAVNIFNGSGVGKVVNVVRVWAFAASFGTITTPVDIEYNLSIVDLFGPGGTTGVSICPHDTTKSLDANVSITTDGALNSELHVVKRFLLPVSQLLIGARTGQNLFAVNNDYSIIFRIWEGVKPIRLRANECLSILQKAGSNTETNARVAFAVEFTVAN